MANHMKQLRFVDQLALLKLRGISGISLKVSNYASDQSKTRIKLQKDLKKISEIGYYNLKSYANPFF